MGPYSVSLIHPFKESPITGHSYKKKNHKSTHDLISRMHLTLLISSCRPATTPAITSLCPAQREPRQHKWSTGPLQQTQNYKQCYGRYLGLNMKCTANLTIQVLGCRFNDEVKAQQKRSACTG